MGALCQAFNGGGNKKRRMAGGTIRRVKRSAYFAVRGDLSEVTEGRRSQCCDSQEGNEPEREGELTLGFGRRNAHGASGGPGKG